MEQRLRRNGSLRSRPDRGQRRNNFPNHENALVIQRFDQIRYDAPCVLPLPANGQRRGSSGLQVTGA